MNEEISSILNMMQEGKIDSEKATELITALRATNVDLTKADSTINKPDIAISKPEIVSSNPNKMLRVRVQSANGDNVNVNVPVKFIKAIGGAINRLPQIEQVKGLEEIDIKAIVEAIDNDIYGKIVDIKSSKGDIVEVVIE